MWWPVQMVWTYATGRLPPGPLYIQCQCRAAGVADVQDPRAMTTAEVLKMRSVAVRKCNVCEPGKGHINLAPRLGVPEAAHGAKAETGT